MVNDTRSETNDEKFDRVMGKLTGLPDVKETRPSTVQDVTPIAGDVMTYIVQMMRTPDQGYVGFLQVVDGQGRARLILPHRLIERICQQRERLTDRSTPESRARRARARAAAKKRKDREARRARYAAK